MADIDALSECGRGSAVTGLVDAMPSGDSSTLRVTIALGLMRVALFLLDRAGASLPAIHLSIAIELASGMPIPRTLEEMEGALEKLSAGRLR